MGSSVLDETQLRLPGRLLAAPFPGDERLELFRFVLAGNSAGAAGCGLQWLGGDLRAEYWQGENPVSSGDDEGVSWSRSGDLLFLGLALTDSAGSDPCATARSIYERLLAAAVRAGCPALLRAWNYMPAITHGSGDSERYRRFCQGRAAALDAAGYGEDALCAATAIGGSEPLMRVYLLCAPKPGINIENPRQVSAFHYPREYGPRSPAFARATVVGGQQDSLLLLISGTASVVGHQSVHEGNVAAQLEEVIRNVEHLAETAADRVGRSALAGFSESTLIRVYVRHSRDWPMVEKRLRQRWPAVRLAGLKGEVCRSELLVELEAVTAA
ncbi:MAG TPA: hypothetical protein VK064_00180 [Wenzhouxiangella sp.]|nr:hypothetical protein [Wenzhouxiangella sp.]